MRLEVIDQLDLNEQLFFELTISLKFGESDSKLFCFEIRNSNFRIFESLKKTVFMLIVIQKLCELVEFNLISYFIFYVVFFAMIILKFCLFLFKEMIEF